MIDARITHLLLALATVGLCAADTINLFPVNNAPVFKINEIVRLMQLDLDPLDVARLLSRTHPKTDQLPSGHQVSELVKLNELKLATDCVEGELSKRNAICHKLEGSLRKYCETCVRLAKEKCLESVVEVVEGSIGMRTGAYYVDKISDYIAMNKVRGNYPRQFYVVDAMYTFSDGDRKNYMTFCRDTEERVAKSLGHLGAKPEFVIKRLKESKSRVARIVEDCDFALGPKFLESSAIDDQKE